VPVPQSGRPDLAVGGWQDAGSCAYAGGGGNYLSNESAYRNTLLRDRLKAHVAAGHIHTPYMQNFARADLYNPSDSTFAAWRSAIVAQGKKLIRVVGDNAP
jgi:pyrrolidone-carboxylate peptidase